MCTLAVCFKVFDGFSLVVAANRDEFSDRPSLGPQVLCGEPRVFGPHDARAGGTWTGLNEFGLFAALTNISGVAERNPDLASRGLLVLDALRCQSAADAAARISHSARPGVYNPFQAVLADRHRLFVVKYIEGPRVEERGSGVHAFSNWDEFEDVGAFKGELVRARIGSIPKDDVGAAVPALKALLSDHSGGEWHHRLCVHTDGYGTMSAQIFALGDRFRGALYLWAGGHPCETTFEDVTPAMKGVLGW
ncbi:MAG: NRDE family protein [Deltaproteobacteria bacterium]|nr:NRDE family protein [Deltaproteobacteria bacterium]